MTPQQQQKGLPPGCATNAHSRDGDDVLVAALEAEAVDERGRRLGVHLVVEGATAKVAALEAGGGGRLTLLHGRLGGGGGGGGRGRRLLLGALVVILGLQQVAPALADGRCADAPLLALRTGQTREYQGPHR